MASVKNIVGLLGNNIAAIYIDEKYNLTYKWEFGVYLEQTIQTLGE